MAAYLRRWGLSQAPKKANIMRTALFFLIVAAGCTPAPSGQNGLFGTGWGLATTAQTTAYSQRRGAVELLVKTNYATLLSDITAGSGPTLTRAMSAAGIPTADRPARIIQLQSDLPLYQVNPGALVTALMAYGG